VIRGRCDDNRQFDEVNILNTATAAYCRTHQLHGLSTCTDNAVDADAFVAADTTVDQFHCTLYLGGADKRPNLSISFKASRMTWGQLQFEHNLFFILLLFITAVHL